MLSLIYTSLLQGHSFFLQYQKKWLFAVSEALKEKYYFGDGFSFPKNVFPSDFRVFHSLEIALWNMANHLLSTLTGIATFITLDLSVAFDISWHCSSWDSPGASGILCWPKNHYSTLPEAISFNLLNLYVFSAAGFAVRFIFCPQAPEVCILLLTIVFK